MQLAEGLNVRYKNNEGPIVFYCERSLSIRVREFPDKSRNVHIVVYSYDYDKIELLSDNQQHART